MKNCFPHYSTKMAEIQKMSLASENTLETEYFMPLNHFSNFSNFRSTQHFMRFWGTFLNAKTRGVAGWIWHFWGRGFDGDVQNCVLVEFGVVNTSKKWRGLNKSSRFFVFFSVFLVNFRGFLASQLKKKFSFKVLYHEKHCATQYWRDEREFYLPGITREIPGKHPGKVHLLTFWVKEACVRIKTTLAKLVGIFSKT